MDLHKNKFIIFHSGGGGGDFLAMCINKLYYNDSSEINYFENDIQVSGNFFAFKDYCLNLSNNENLIYTDKVTYCMTSHHYHPKLKINFKNSKLFYINSVGYQKEIVNRLNTIHNMPFTTRNLIEMKRWNNTFQSNEIQPINQDIFFSYESFKNTIENCFSMLANDQLEEEYNKWFGRNRHFFNL